MSAATGLIGLTLGTGAYLVVTCPTPWRARRFVRRVQDYLHPATARRGEALQRLVGRARLHAVAERQRRAGLHADPAGHLIAVATWAAAGLALGAGIVAAMLVAGSLRQPLAAVLLLVMCVVSGGLLADRRLDTAARRRRQRAAIELPSTAETLSLAVAAGAALPHALELLVQRQRGVLPGELAVVVRDIRAGTPMDRALAALCDRLPVPSVTRFVDALRIALERGTPVVDVLHAQAFDARNESRRLLMERAGKREVSMLAPVVFLVLPAVVAVALFPGFSELGSLAAPL